MLVSNLKMTGLHKNTVIYQGIWFKPKLIESK